MTENQRWFKPMIAALRRIDTKEDLQRHLVEEDRRTEAALALGPLDADLVRHLFAQHDPLALVLRGRLYLEEMLDAVVAKKFKHGEALLQGRSYSFSVKMDLLRAAGYLDPKMYHDLHGVSRLRNSFAHHLGSDISEYDLSVFTDCAGLKAVTQNAGVEARQWINIFMFRQIVLQILRRLAVRNKLTPKQESGQAEAN